MPIEIRIISGAHAGQIKRFEQAVIVVGRQAGLDLRFDPQQDLDVSGRHAEIRATETGYAVHDTRSTNGTFVNGKKVDGSVELKDGDKVKFGTKGPETEISFTAERSKHIRTPVGSTEQRIAIAVTEQTAGLKRALVAGLILVVVGGIGGVWYVRRQSTQRIEQFQQLLQRNDSVRVALQGRLGQFGDTALINGLQRDLGALRNRLPGATTDAERETIRREIQELESRMRRMVQMDLPAIFKENSGAVAIIISEIGGKSFSGSGFSITKEGLIVTNRHNVLMDGKSPTRIAVKFTDTPDWLPARVVKVSDNPDEDIALIQMTREDSYPFVNGISGSLSDASEGMSVAIIGYPLGQDTPMEGAGKDFIAKASLNTGTVSKKTSSVLQIDSYATHGSSGSPLFGASGHVVGVIYGGAAEAGGKIVYAVPSDRLAAFLPPELKSVVKD